MPVSLAQAKLNAATPVDRNVIDEFRRASWLLDNMVFDPVVNAAGAGATLTYGYTRLVTPPGAAFRAINSEYTPSEATKQQYTVDLKVLGGSFQIDRVLDKVAAGAETAFQMQQKIKAAANKFADRVVNGDSSSDTNGWDGLSKSLTGSATEITVGSGNTIDLTAVTSQATAFAVMAKIDQLLSQLNGPASAIFANRGAIALIQGAARYALQLSTVEAFGRPVPAYNGVPLIDLGDVVASDGTATNVIPTASTLTDIYAVSLGMSGFHGVALAGQPLVRTWLPDFTTPGAVKTGEVEMVCAPVLKAVHAAAVLRKVKVA